MKITLADVAKLAGVSPTTVSRVLRGAYNPRPVSEEVQRRVLEAAAKLGYQPNPIAQALSTRRTHILGLVLLSPSQLTHPYSAAIVQGALEVAHRHGYHITLIPTEQWRGALSRDSRILTMTDGIIITTRRSIVPDDLAKVREQVPIVLVQFRFPNNDMPSVHADYRTAAHLVAEHLNQRKVSEIGILWARGVSAHPNKPVLRSVFEEDFLPTLQTLAKEMNIAFDPTTDVRSVAISTDVAAVRREVCQWLKIAQRPAALCVADDFVAGVVLQVAAEKRLKVPDDLAVISLNDLGIAEKLLPPVTALHISPDELGRKAAQALIEWLDEGRLPENFDIAIPPRLIVRASA
ncbi:Ribose operon repressor [bacterium HR17]|uniref:Ribose operon repressor n=1 Tax=Candidatus Fervidibacter japonicus TaxID=2035412 RepID=A0A2H5XFG7_9BACT|nr:Ribose operon repressor [bacterium HR17]